MKVVSEMKIANIKVYKNLDGTVSIRDIQSLDDSSSLIVFPIEMIPTISKALSIIYAKNNGQSDILYQDGEEDE